MKDYLRSSRRDYAVTPLSRSDLHDNPIENFKKWFLEAVQAGITDANSFVLATASKDGKPSVRVLLLRDFEDERFVFYTNYESRKGVEIAQNPQVAMNFYWQILNRQIRIEGAIEKITPEESDRYFKTRPKESQLAAIISPQSTPVESSEFLLKNFKKIAKQYQNNEPPRPESWGGYAVSPKSYEFWQGRPNRLHDRFAFLKQKNNLWKVERLWP